MADFLQIRTLGGLSILSDGDPVEGFASRKAQVLLAYLASNPRVHRREVLADLLWDDRTQRRALGNLRVVLSSLRKGVGPFVTITRDTAAINPERIWLDVAELEAALARDVTAQTADGMAEACDLYRGDLLAGMHIRDARGFEEWLVAERERLHRLVLGGHRRLGDYYRENGRFRAGIAHATRLLELDPLLEAGHRQLMALLAQSGQPGAAVAQYETCRRLLDEELGMAPSRRTTEMYRQIVAGELPMDAGETRRARGYELKEEIGAGAYGTIYRAIQPAIGREVAVKVIRRQYADDPDFIRRFEAEAQTVARLEHPYIVPLYDYWRDPDGAYLVMRLLRGGDLRAALADGPWGMERTTQLVEQVTSALAAAHRKGIVHRDIKPANILFDEGGNAYLSDFGIAKDLRQQEPLMLDEGMAGTPDYSSPEQLRAEPVTPQADLYSLGAVLYEMLAGEPPFSGVPLALRIQKHLQEPLPLVTARRPKLPPQLDEVIQRATAKSPSDRYPDALALAQAFRLAARGNGALTQASEIQLLPSGVAVGNPYKGLRAFQESDASEFYGRDALVQQLVCRLADSRFLAVIGPSGSGKSSLVKAGLIPALRQEGIPGADKWFVAEMVPGSHPLEELALALLPIAVDPPASLLEPLQKDERGLLRTVRRILPDEEGAELLLVIDQFEELFTATAAEHRQRFLDSLLTALAAERTPLRVVVTLRADFYDRPLQMPPLATLFKEQAEIVLPLNREELTRAIVEPARQSCVHVEEALVTEMVADVAGQPGALPLLQYALTELFEEREGSGLTLAAYRELGGVSGALARRADELFAGFAEDAQDLTRQLFLRLVTLGEGVEDTRRRVLRSELEGMQGAERGKTDAVLDAFGRYRLLTFDHDPLTRAPTVEVAHEALLREWPRLRGWLDESRDDVRLQRRLADAAAEWAQAGRDDGYLLRGSRLDLLAGWEPGTDLGLTAGERAFLDSSSGARERRRAADEERRQRELETAQQLAETEHRRAEEQAQAAHSLRRRAFYLGGALVVAAILAVLALAASRQSSSNAAAALENANLAATSEAEAITNANVAATRQVEARANADLALAQEEEASVQREIALDEAEQRATAQARAEREAQIAFSRELASAALLSLGEDPERSILLAQAALVQTHTVEAEEALHQATQASRVRQTFIAPQEMEESVTAWLAMSPDGRRIFTSGLNGGVMWERDSGEIVYTRTVPGPENSAVEGVTERLINRADFSPDGSLLALPNELWIDETPLTGTITILAPETGEELLTFPALGGGVQDVTFSPDGRQLAAVGLDSAINVWDVVASLAAGTGVPAATLCCHEETDWVNSVNYSPDGSQLVTTADDGTVRAWDVAAGEELLVIDIVAFDAVFSPDGRYLIVVGESGTIFVLEADSGELYSTVPAAHLLASLMVEFGPDGSRFVTSGNDGRVQIWDFFDGEVGTIPLVLAGHKGRAVSAAFAPDGRYVATGSDDGTARIWNVTSSGAAEYGAYQHEGRAIDVAFSPDGSRLASTSLDGTAKVWDVDGREVLFTLPHEEQVREVDYHPDGRTLSTISNDGTLRIWDGQSGKELRVIPAHEPGGSFSGGAQGLAYSPSGERVATGGGDHLVRLWSVETGEELLTLTGHTNTVNVVTYSPDGRWLVTADADATIKVWDAASGRELWTLSGEPSEIYGAAFDDTGSRLVVAHRSGQVIVWQFPEAGGEDGVTPEIAVQFQQNEGPVGLADFSPDGETLAVGGSGQTSLHDADTGELMVNLGQPATSVAFSPDGRMLATAGGDGEVRLLAPNLDELLALAESRLTRKLTEEECQRYLHMETCPER